MKTMTITQLGEARHRSPVSFSVGDDVFIPADVQWTGRNVPEDAMAGKTGLVISFLNGQFVHVPINIVAQGSKRLDLDGELWRAVLSSTCQPARFS